MHTIDLLRGQGIPARTTLGGVALIIIGVAVPLLIAAAMLDRYLRNRTVISIQRQAIVSEQAAIDELSDAVELMETLETRRELAWTRLSEVSSCIGRYVQWSPVLVTLAENMPTEVVLTKLTASRKQVTVKVSDKNDRAKSVSISVPKRALILNISGSPWGNHDKAIKDFRENLELSPLLGPKLEDIVVSQESGRLGDDQVVSYVMNCVFEAAF